MNRPRNLFHYEPITLQRLRNLKGQVVHLGSPRNFNDPYDCALGAVLGDLTDGDLKRLLRGVKVNATDATLKAMFKDSTRKTLSELAERFLDQRGVSCFTESNDNLLMWSHYADGGRGMCLEFSTSEPLFERARPVTYTDSIPTLGLGAILCGHEYERITDLFRTKSIHWKYETEWRVIHETAGTNWIYQTDSLLGVYFGPNTPSDLLEIVCLVLKGQNKSVRLYKGTRSQTTFKVAFDEINYISYLEACDAGLK